MCPPPFPRLLLAGLLCQKNVDPAPGLTLTVLVSDQSPPSRTHFDRLICRAGITIAVRPKFCYTFLRAVRPPSFLGLRTPTSLAL